MAGILVRLTRTTMLAALREDWVRTARAQGRPEWRVFRRPRAPLRAASGGHRGGPQAGGLLAGAIITETIFAWPGLGRLVVQAIDARDYPLVQGCVLAIAFTYLLMNTATDLLHRVLDPRLRDARSGGRFTARAGGIVLLALCLLGSRRRCSRPRIRWRRGSRSGSTRRTRHTRSGATRSAATCSRACSTARGVVRRRRRDALLLAADRRHARGRGGMGRRVARRGARAGDRRVPRVPGLLLAIALAAVLGPSLANVVLALSVLGWPGYARLARAEVAGLRRREFVHAAEALGARPARIVLAHILPLAVPTLLVQATFGIAGAIVAEASLSFLGLGVAPPTPSWGGMIAEGRTFMLVAPHVILFPGLALAATVLALQLLATGSATPSTFARRDAGDRRGSTLAARAVEARAARVQLLADRGRAPAAGLSRAVVHVVAQLELARAAEAVAVVGDRRAARWIASASTSRIDATSARSRRAPDAPPTAGADGGVEQRLVDVDVAEPGHAPLVHQQRLDARPPPAREAEQRVGGEGVGQRVDALARLHAERVAADHRDAAEAARVVEGEEPPVVERDHDVVVDAIGTRRRRDRELSGHTEVHEQDGAVVEPREQVLPTAREASDPAALSRFAKSRATPPRRRRSRSRTRTTRLPASSPASERTTVSTSGSSGTRARFAAPA
jgi:ABC-type dipeptide/oligopeptide/nickel transport system permease subunit